MNRVYRFTLLQRFTLAMLGLMQIHTAFADRPNVVLIMSDDQGVGDYGFMGNPVIRTPALDQMRASGGLMKRFYVSPVCAPTRASLMTGRYNYRTRCVDTYVGRAMMDPDEVTLAELLRDAGYRTGIYGKWHLGDNYPLRAMDQGFQDSLVHRGGGIGQPSDPLGAEGKYTDPTLFRNGVKVSLKGYCTDLYFDAAIDFIEEAVEAKETFFTYVATNAPHGPFHDVPPDLYQDYKQVDFEPILVSQINPKRRTAELDKLARIAAMITNIDQNVAKLFEQLDRLGIAENTIVIYLNDNGPNTLRYVGEMRGRKSEVHDGGIRSPLLFHWPKKIPAAATSDQFAAHIDVLPTILDACGVDQPANLKIDGRSFLSLLTQPSTDDSSTRWPKRQVVFQSHRGNVPQIYNHFAIHEGRWKLVHPSGFGNETIRGEPKLELYDLGLDPKQQSDLADAEPQVVERLKAGYEAWFADVSSTRKDNYAPPRIVIGTKHENPTVLTRQDWRHDSGRPWGKTSNGFWLLRGQEAARFQIELILPEGQVSGGVATITVGDQTTDLDLESGQRRGHIATISFPKGNSRLAVEVKQGERTFGPHQVILKKSE